VEGHPAESTVMNDLFCSCSYDLLKVKNVLCMSISFVYLTSCISSEKTAIILREYLLHSLVKYVFLIFFKRKVILNAIL
jgi:hypothetical protein